MSPPPPDTCPFGIAHKICMLKETGVIILHKVFEGQTDGWTDTMDTIRAPTSSMEGPK